MSWSPKTFFRTKQPWFPRSTWQESAHSGKSFVFGCRKTSDKMNRHNTNKKRRFANSLKSYTLLHKSKQFPMRWEFCSSPHVTVMITKWTRMSTTMKTWAAIRFPPPPSPQPKTLQKGEKRQESVRHDGSPRTEVGPEKKAKKSKIFSKKLQKKAYFDRLQAKKLQKEAHLD